MECRWCHGTDKVFDPPREFFDLGAKAMIFYFQNPYLQETFNCHHVQGNDDPKIAKAEEQRKETDKQSERLFAEIDRKLGPKRARWVTE
jgi:hypothetical protein